ncbi:MAG: [Oscillospiraceae bacterium]|nr:[FeFe] hydrogenase H-cluster maturation GTPase HydF [Oscillospiraceae bacterium]
MSLNSTPSADRLHIGLFGKRNAGKSSVINAVTNQEIAIVSDIKGTTTDPVYKAMELLPIGPVMIIDTPGLDDEGELGARRIEKTHQVLNKTDLAVLVIDCTIGMTDMEQQLIKLFKEKTIPYVIVYNKFDLFKEQFPEKAATVNPTNNEVYVSAQTGENIEALKNMLPLFVPDDESDLRIIGDMLAPGDVVVLVVPIDSAAPKGRLILPQQQTIRDIMDAGAIAVVTKDTELRQTLASLSKKPRMVITDSQVFAKVSADTPDDIPLTSFSILFGRYKGNMVDLIAGVNAVNKLKDNDKILISEGCTHHRQCEDIGTVKIPRWLKQHTGKNLQIVTSSGTSFPRDLSDYALVVHCGGCVLNRREMQHRIQLVKQHNVPIVNYGILISYLQGILHRSVQPFPELASLIEEK